MFCSILASISWVNCSSCSVKISFSACEIISLVLSPGYPEPPASHCKGQKPVCRPKMLNISDLRSVRRNLQLGGLNGIDITGSNVSIQSQYIARSLNIQSHYMSVYTWDGGRVNFSVDEVEHTDGTKGKLSRREAELM